MVSISIARNQRHPEVKEFGVIGHAIPFLCVTPVRLLRSQNNPEYRALLHKTPTYGLKERETWVWSLFKFYFQTKYRTEMIQFPKSLSGSTIRTHYSTPHLHNV